MNAFSTPMTNNTQFLNQIPSQFNNGISQNQPNLMMNFGFSMVHPLQANMPNPQLTYIPPAPTFNNAADLFTNYASFLNPTPFPYVPTLTYPAPTTITTSTTIPQLNVNSCTSVEPQNKGTEITPLPKNFDSFNLPVNHSFFLQCVGPDGIESFQAISKDFMLNPMKHFVFLYNEKSETKLEPFTVKELNKPAVVHSVKKPVSPEQNKSTVVLSTFYSSIKKMERN
jgi:hypothetical protein